MRLTTISFHNSCCKKSWGPVWFCHIAHEYLYNSTSVICKGWHTIFLSKRAKSEWLCYLVTFGNLRRTLGTFDIVRKSPEVFRSSWPRVDSVVTFLSVERLTKSFMWRNQKTRGICPYVVGKVLIYTIICLCTRQLVTQNHNGNIKTLFLHE